MWTGFLEDLCHWPPSLLPLGLLMGIEAQRLWVGPELGSRFCHLPAVTLSTTGNLQASASPSASGAKGSLPRAAGWPQALPSGRCRFSGVEWHFLSALIFSVADTR
ncbi:hypothetical protein H1C71_018471 [Ictidomys tridecemlineatus]|nr:hypothetical protein H1C71_018471 [Ictidomys tridecemlineatus]KAG3263437.1 hypothetical protein H1C71_018471 [Ictidomys tridecemlineatus]KAG3263438.1 hypothetical protein H1C71_018471 [Ictidomys tridecemlineatus]KAG3263439.1 hypothetical protein H1C71_018471 [Ictidomys tridecemlineatus]KAG3263440.1 hypothetical protein H1C71_018471 [Ictidomys tridecemlineatus]